MRRRRYSKTTFPDCHRKGGIIVARNRKTTIAAIAFILPFISVYTVFTIWPVIQGIYVSFFKWTLSGKQKFVGLQNFRKLLTDQNFIQSLGNTFKFVIITAPVVVVFALILALLANREWRGRRFLRVAYYIPSILSVSVASFMAKYILMPYSGFISDFLHTFHLMNPGTEIQWLQDKVLVWFSVVGMTAWWTVGFSMLIYLAALQEIDAAVMEAASIDGASPWKKLIYITLPLLKPTTLMIGLLQVISCFKIFGQVYMMTGGGPASSTRTIIQYIYETAFEKNNMGYGAAMSYVLFFIIATLSALQLKHSGKGGDK